MKLIEDLRRDEKLSSFICKECSENNVSVDFSAQVDIEKILILQIDKYYNSLKANIPPSPDCLIIQNCNENRYVVYIVELKNIKDLKGYKISDIREKFVTCLHDFMSNRFRQYFYDETHDFTSSLHLIFVAPAGITSDPTKTKSSKLDNLLSLPLIPFANKKYPIKFKTPNPIVQPCSE